jgi:hypothetical protein
MRSLCCFNFIAFSYRSFPFSLTLLVSLYWRIWSRILLCFRMLFSSSIPWRLRSSWFCIYLTTIVFERAFELKAVGCTECFGDFSWSLFLLFALLRLSRLWLLLLLLVNFCAMNLTFPMFTDWVSNDYYISCYSLLVSIFCVLAW